ncbi:hypothetical protein K1719_032908 [Acacia pycnantha]|nr:hypothetical protein K1719_032908 [Acacia pycnantha]
MMEEELERMKEASQADPSIVIQAPARHQKWKAARMKGDKYINEDVAEVASKIAGSLGGKSKELEVAKAQRIKTRVEFQEAQAMVNYF